MPKRKENDNCALIRNELISNIKKNQGVEKHGHRFSEKIYYFAKLLHNMSPKTYDLLKDILIFPSISMLNEYFSENDKSLIEYIQDIEYIPDLIQQYKEMYGIDGPIESILSIDAASLDRPFKKAFSYVFVFYLQPLHPDLKCIPLYIFPKNNGFANNEILCIADQIKGILQDLDIIVTTIATDGDTGYNSKAKETFSKYISVFLQKGFLKAVEHIQNSNDEVFWISDFLHLLKLARKQFIKGSITIRNSIKNLFSNYTLENILHLGSPLIDVSSLSFMKDYYAIKIFNLKNVIKLYDNNNNDELIYFLPFALWAESLMSLSLKSLHVYTF